MCNWPSSYYNTARCISSNWNHCFNYIFSKYLMVMRDNRSGKLDFTENSLCNFVLKPFRYFHFLEWSLFTSNLNKFQFIQSVDCVTVFMSIKFNEIKSRVVEKISVDSDKFTIANGPKAYSTLPTRSSLLLTLENKNSNPHDSIPIRNWVLRFHLPLNLNGDCFRSFYLLEFILRNSWDSNIVAAASSCCRKEIFFVNFKFRI